MKYLLDGSGIPQGSPQSLGTVYMHYGMLLASAPSPVLLTQINAKNSYQNFNNLFIGNETSGWYMIVTILEAKPDSLVPPQGFSPIIMQWPSPPSSVNLPRSLGTIPLDPRWKADPQTSPAVTLPSQPYSLDIHLKVDDTGKWLSPYYVFGIYMFDLVSRIYFDSLTVQIDIYDKFPAPGSGIDPIKSITAGPDLKGTEYSLDYLAIISCHLLLMNACQRSSFTVIIFRIILS